MKTLLVVNPTAGRGRAGRLADLAERAAREAWGAVERVETTAPRVATDLVRAAVGAGVERVLVLGGDGTVHEAANGLLCAAVAERPPLAVLPAGTGNDYAKLSGTFGPGPVEAIRRLRRGTVRRFDVGCAWGEYFLNAIGIGFDAAVAKRVNESKSGGGILAYLAAVAGVISRFKPFEVRVKADGVSFTDRLLLLEIGIGSCVGGGFRLTPAAAPDDGLFDICAIQHLSVPGLLAKLPLAILGKHTRLRQVRMFRTASLSVETPSGILHAQFDGELRDLSASMEIRIEPRALPVLTVRT